MFNICKGLRCQMLPRRAVYSGFMPKAMASQSDFGPCSLDLVDGNSNNATSNPPSGLEPRDERTPSIPSASATSQPHHPHQKFLPPFTASSSSSSTAQCDSRIRGTSCGSTPVIDSPCSVGSDGSLSWNGIPRVKRKWVDVVEGKETRHGSKLSFFLKDEKCLF